MGQQVVFYSWQSWTDPAANRNFIEDCLERAIKEIGKDDSLKLDPVIDRDTQNVPGSADIANTILGKVAEADVFVGDVSLVITDPSTQRQTSNPNVLVELGYALGKLGEDKLICVHNLATGRIEDLPFDIRGRTVATYELPAKAMVDAEAQWLELRAEQRKQFVSKLKHALVAVLSAPDQALTDFVTRMAEKLILVIIFGSEVDDRLIKPGSEELRGVMRGIADDLRAMGCEETAPSLNLSGRLEELANALEEAVHFTRYSGKENYDQYVGLVRRSVELATSIKKDCVDPHPPSRDNLNALHRRLYEMRRQLDKLLARLPDLLRRPSGLDEVYITANALGLDLCRYGQFDLNPIQLGLANRLFEIGRQLHLVGVTRDYPSGQVRAGQKGLETLQAVATAFAGMVDGLPLPR
jgi:hypothetical protein